MNKDELRTRVGPNTLALRRRYGLSRKSLARLTGMPESRLRRVEAGDPAAKVYDYELLRLCRIFDISLEELLDGIVE